MRSFFAPSAREALLLAREELGDQARILTTRATADGVELVVVNNFARTGSGGESLAIQQELKLLRARIANFESNAPAGLQDLNERLRSAGITGDLRSLALAAAAPHGGTLAFDAASLTLANQIPILPSRPPHASGPRLVALVGPTGVGKTTTIAKLAGRLTRQSKRKVALLTFDTYRIGAVEQLRAYADMLAAPFGVLFTPADLIRAPEKYRDCDIILIDTTGRSPNDAERLAELASTLGHAERLETLLVLSATQSLESVRSAAREFQATKPTGLVITKLDETEHCGPAITVAFEQKLPLAFLCTGQEVPGDLERATGERAAHFILKASAEAARANV
ncbi:MAG: GTPase [Planctomycetota bacterium]